MRRDEWTCDGCGAEVTGEFPGDWITLDVAVGSGFLKSYTGGSHYCSPVCAGKAIVGAIAASKVEAAA